MGGNASDSKNEWKCPEMGIWLYSKKATVAKMEIGRVSVMDEIRAKVGREQI